MRSGLKALLTEIIDYAGLFPPAKLELDTALENYARYRGESDAWMLRDFVCPATRLDELTPRLADVVGDGDPVSLSLICGGGDDLGDYEANLREQMLAVERFLAAANADAGRPRARIAAIETRIPENFARVAGDEDVLAYLVDLGTILRGVDLEDAPTFVEIPPLEDWRRALQTVCDGLRDYRLTTQRPGGLKLRCGGLEPSAFPSCEQVATAIATCRDSGVPLKFTAGLHHPVRHVSAAMQCYMHGFLNVFVAGVLADALQLDYPDILAIVEEEDARQFVFDDDGLSWATARASLAETQAARRVNVTSFGSCSFDEPRDDLRALRLL